jgi:hypothetical protein
VAGDDVEDHREHDVENGRAEPEGRAESDRRGERDERPEDEHEEDDLFPHRANLRFGLRARVDRCDSDGGGGRFGNKRHAIDDLLLARQNLGLLATHFAEKLSRGNKLTPHTRWEQLPARLGPLLAVHLDELSDEVMDAVRSEVSLFDRPLEGSFGRGIKLGVHEALRQFCRLVETQGSAETNALVIYEELGRGEWRHGRPLEALLAAYRVGARVSWRRFALVGAEAGLGTEELVALAELVFAHIDELSAASAEGYADEQSAAVGERDRQRLALLRVLLNPSPDLDSIIAAARLARWPIPQSLCVVLAPPGAPLGTLLGPEALVIDGDPALAIVGDPAPYPRLGAVLGDTAAVVGPIRNLDGAAASRDRATAVFALRTEGRLAKDTTGPVCTEAYLSHLLLLAGPAIAQDLAETLLAPLAKIPAATADRLVETLRAWLQHAGERAPAAEALHVHPQTVRYRMGQLRELLGAVIDDPGRRLDLLLAVEARSTDLTAPRR